MKKTLSYIKAWHKRRMDNYYAGLAGVLCALAIAGVFYMYFSSDNKTQMLEDIRNFVLTMGALIAFPLGLHRMAIAKKQLGKSEEQTEKYQRQVETAQKQLIMSQYNSARRLLWSANVSERVASINDLWEFANSYSEEEYKRVANDFYSFLKKPPVDGDYRSDIVQILFYVQEMNAKNIPDLKINPKNFNLREINLSHADLRHVRLQGANLHRANLNNSNLQSVDLHETNLSSASLYKANLMGANLQKANLQEVNLQTATLISANLHNTNLHKASLIEANLQKANLQKANLQKARLEKADFTGANLAGTILDAALVNGANFSDTQLTEKQIKDCVFALDYPNRQEAERPTLPEDLKPDYKVMEHKGWRNLYHQ